MFELTRILFGLYFTSTTKVADTSNSLHNKLNSNISHIQIGIKWIFSMTGKQQNQCGLFGGPHT